MKRNIFITGGLGFLGSYLMKEVLSDHDNIITLLVRDKNGLSGERRTELLFKNAYPRHFNDVKKRIRVLKGDITEKRMGMSKSGQRPVIKNTDAIYHCAALCNFAEPLYVLRKINVQGARNLLDLAFDCHRFGRLSHVHHISSVAIAGTKRKVFYEDMLDEGQGFNNHYEQSKFEAEKLVNEYRNRGMNIYTFRPSVIVGDSITGKTGNFDIFYQFLKILSLEIYNSIPVDGNSLINLVPVDKVAESVYLIANREKQKNMTFNILNLKYVTIRFIIDVASEFFGFKKPRFTPSKRDLSKRTYFQKKLLNIYLPYCDYKTTFDTTNSDAILKNHNFLWPKPNRGFLETLFRYCAKIGYIKLEK
ncbi:MAG: SDR family oxidoreductase [Candidatus Omnitrophota bacterium]